MATSRKRLLISILEMNSFVTSPIAMPQMIRTLTSSNYFCIPLTYGDLKTRDDRLVHCEYMHENADHDLKITKKSD